MNINGYELELPRISNYMLYQKIINDPKFEELPYPEVPKFYIEKQKRWVENPNSAEYLRDIEVYEIAKTNLIIDIVLANIMFDYKQIDDNQIRALKRSQLNGNLHLAILKYIIIKDHYNVNKLIQEILLTETLVYKYITLLTVTRNGIDILKHDLRNPAKTNIDVLPITIGGHELVNPLYEYTACVDTGLDWMKWLNNDYQLNDMAYTIAMYRLNKLIDIHSQDELQK